MNDLENGSLLVQNTTNEAAAKTQSKFHCGQQVPMSICHSIDRRASFGETAHRVHFVGQLAEHRSDASGHTDALLQCDSH